jgi:hypothetical protein
MTIRDKSAIVETQQFVVVEVERHGNHVHSSNEKMPQLRGETRKQVVEQCLTLSKGSATAAVEDMVASHHLAGKVFDFT